MEQAAAATTLERAAPRVEPGAGGWQGPHPSGRVATAHKILGIIYLVPALLGGVLAAFSGSMGEAGRMSAPATALLVMAGLHFLLMVGARRKQGWSQALSVVVGLLLLVAVPIGTIFGFVILRNACKSWK